VKLTKEDRTMIFYESPHKLLKTLNDFSNSFGADRKISVSREITKIYEETIRGSVEHIINLFTDKIPKGEFVIIVEGCKN
jgi:16S rRNA (cytidine1402-2'-O)-methyltransferase